MLVSKSRIPPTYPFALTLDPSRARGIVCALALGTLIFLLLRPFLAIGHELLVVSLAGLVRSLSGASLWPALIGSLPLDPVYTLALVHFAGEIQARGVAVAGPVGGMLHTILPGLFTPPELVTGNWASAVLEPGSTVLARGLASFGADLALLLAGLAIAAAGRGGRSWLVVCGALQQAHVVLYHLFDAGLSLRDFEAAGLPFALSSLLSEPSHRAPWFTNDLAQLSEPAVAAGTGVVLTALAYVLASGLLIGLLVAWQVAFRRSGRPDAAPRRPLRALGWLRIGSRSTAVLGLGVAALAASPLGAFAEAETSVLGSAQVGSVATRAGSLPSLFASRQASGPVSVRFAGQGYHYSLLVDDAPRFVHGMGYNVQYGGLGLDERARRYDRDFAAMRASGVNVIFGWFQDVFDRLTLAKARQYGLGVGMPYELNQDLDYADPAVRAQITADVLAWVAQNKDDPAVWFWTPGNEVIHRLIFPSWLKHQQDVEREARADSFASFYVELIDQIHALDPKHPIIYRDAEEVYLPRIRNALLRDGVARPWFAYGTNVYTRRLEAILAEWPNQGLDAPLLVSEFAPGGAGPADRPQGFRNMWSTIRAYPSWVIGGAVYTWTTDGPEELDKVFGLVDGTGQPRDDALATIAELYNYDRPD